MAKENIAKFFDAAMTDPVLAEKLAALAAEHGYDFTAEDLLEFGAARSLSDEDLENTAGGSAGNILIEVFRKKALGGSDEELRDMIRKESLRMQNNR